ncbi:MAG: hypothetical protein N7Q72_04620, partial [Spiroplasma sp. Tabriz.8]|nr:hypothetical protein [Candidatus Karelsulcia muelleri]MCZ8632530.1 hypothetical protein [Spiroplasma sp. Tabriz.8]
SSHKFKKMHHLLMHLPHESKFYYGIPAYIIFNMQHIYIYIYIYIRITEFLLFKKLKFLSIYLSFINNIYIYIYIY